MNIHHCSSTASKFTLIKAVHPARIIHTCSFRSCMASFCPSACQGFFLYSNKNNHQWANVCRNLSQWLLSSSLACESGSCWKLLAGVVICVNWLVYLPPHLFPAGQLAAAGRTLCSCSSLLVRRRKRRQSRIHRAPRSTSDRFTFIPKTQTKDLRLFHILLTVLQTWWAC